MLEIVKKKDKWILILFIFCFIVIVSPILFKLFIDFNNPIIEKELSSFEYYGYKLTSTDTDVFKNAYDELSTVLNQEIVDYEEYAKSISKLFVIDVFTLENKVSSTDIGGLEFVHKDLRDNFKENLGSTLYNSVLSNINGKRVQKLPKVSNVSVDSITKDKYEYYDVEYDSFVIKCGITYEVDLGYQSSITLTLIRVDNMLYIVKGE
jgi:hypothetical protein